MKAIAERYEEQTLELYSKLDARNIQQDTGKATLPSVFYMHFCQIFSGTFLFNQSISHTKSGAELCEDIYIFCVYVKAVNKTESNIPPQNY